MSVYKRGDKGMWYMNFTVNGQRVFRSTGKFTKKEAKQVEAMEKQKLLDEAKMTPQERAAKMTLQEAIDKVLEERWNNTKDSSRSYGRGVSLIKEIGNLPLESIDDGTIAKLVKKLEARKVTSATINRYFATLKTVLRHNKQPWDFIKLRKERKGRIRVISPAEEQQAVNLLRNTAHGKRRHFYSDVADLAEVLVDTGMRLSELLNLTYEDVSFETNLMSIWINKGDRPRSIPMTRRVRRIMEERKKRGKTKPFQLKSYQAENAWRWVRKQMGLQNDAEFILHALRHTTASRLVNKGIDLYVVKEWLGHSTIQVTERYAHLSPSKLAHAATVLEL
jgi:integrase